MEWRRRIKRTGGFAMLEAMVMIMVFMILSASLLASAAAYHKRAVKRASNNEAYYAAVTAVKMMAGEVMKSGGSQSALEGTNADSQAAVAALLTAGGMDRQETVIKAVANDGTEREIPVAVSSQWIGKDDGGTGRIFLVLRAEATVGEQTEAVSITLQMRKSNKVVPDYPYGCGLMGNLVMESGSELYLGQDVDLFLTGYTYLGEEPSMEGIRRVGGNLVAKDTPLSLEQVMIGGMVISDQNVTLKESVVGNSSTGKKRRGGIYTRENLSLNNCDIFGDVYAKNFQAEGTEKISGSLNYVERSWKNYTVWDSEGESGNTQEDEYRRGGAVTADGGTKTILLQTGREMEDYVPKVEDVFVPQLDGISDVTVTRIDGKTVNGDSIQVAADEGGRPRWIVVMDGGILNLDDSESPYYVYVYGNGTVNITEGDVTVYGGIQADTVHIAEGATLRIVHTQPSRKSLKTPSSAIGFGSWIPLDYDRETEA